MTRHIKIEERGDFAKKQTFPAIRLKGKWLERAGFTAGSHVRLVMLSPGRMEMINENQIQAG
jgi:hypothetical protein